MSGTSTLAPETNGRSEQLPFSLLIELTVTDAEVIAELWQRPEGRPRDDYALIALRLGVLALKHARGQVDGQALKQEGELLLSGVEGALKAHRGYLDDTLNRTLKDYFDPANGRFNERVERLLKKDGELETLLARKITDADSEMCRTLASHLGEDSVLFRLLSPNESEGLLSALKKNVSDELTVQRQGILKEFSLDNPEGALSRLVKQITDHGGELREDLRGKIDGLLKQFSFDDEQSALSRMSKTVETTNQAISKHLTLDDESSALSRLKREMLGLIEKQTKDAQEFHVAVRTTLERMQARREEAAASTRHGLDFEAQVVAVVQAEAQRLGDIATPVGSVTGIIKNCKKGDAVVEMGPESTAAGARFVIEAKEKECYSLADALKEIEEARRNRQAECGLFIFSKKTAPAGIEPLTRYGQDLVVIWDAEDVTSDVFLKLAISVARALCTRRALERANATVDFGAIDKALAEIEKQVKELDEIRTWTETIQNNSGHILKRLRISREKLTAEAELLRDRINDLRPSLAAP